MHRVKVRVVEDALDANNTIARANREDFDRAGVTVVNLMSAPGAGKTTLLERVLGDGARSATASASACSEGDVEGSLDADRLARLHVPVVAAQHRQRLRRRVPPRRQHGALGAAEPAARRPRPADRRERRQPRLPGRVPRSARTCASWSSSVAEGDDKPLKYPLMFRACELVVLNKIDLLPHVDFDLDRFLYHLDAVHPGVAHLPTSARTGEGVDALRELARAPARPGGGAGVSARRRRTGAIASDALAARATPARRSSPPRPTASPRCATGWPSASRAAGGWSPSARRRPTAPTCATSRSSSSTRSSSASARCPRSGSTPGDVALLTRAGRHRDGLRRRPGDARPRSRPRARAGR